MGRFISHGRLETSARVDELVHIVSVPQSHSKSRWPGVLLISCTAHLISSHQLLTFCYNMQISSLATRGMKFTYLLPQRSRFSLETTRINIESNSNSFKRVLWLLGPKQNLKQPLIILLVSITFLHSYLY